MPIWILNSRMGIQRLPQTALISQFRMPLTNPGLTTAMKGDVEVKRKTVGKESIGEVAGGTAQMEVHAIIEAKWVGRNGGLSFYLVYQYMTN